MAEQRQRRYFLGANWKCNGTTAFTKDIVNHLINDLEYDQNKLGTYTQIINRLNRFICMCGGLSLRLLFLTDIMVLPGFLHLALVSAIVKPGIMVGAQNCSAFAEGAYTGEVAADHIKDYQVHHVMIGHSERRRGQGETQEIVAQKVLQAEDCDLGILYCIGETKEDRE